MSLFRAMICEGGFDPRNARRLEVYKPTKKQSPDAQRMVGQADLTRSHDHLVTIYRQEWDLFDKIDDQTWTQYLETHNLSHAFRALQGTEGQRYQEIADRRLDEVTRLKNLVAKAKKEYEHRREKERADRLAAIPAGVRLQKRPRGRPRKERNEAAKPGTEQHEQLRERHDEQQAEHVNVKPESAQKPQLRELTKTEKSIQEADRLLRKKFQLLTAPRPEKSVFQDHLVTKIETTRGIIPVIDLEPGSSEWFVGDRAGDPIYRYVDPENYQLPEASDVLRIPLSLVEDLDVKCTFRYEGTVPFEHGLSRLRFKNEAFPAFVDVVTAALAFDPTQPRGILADAMAYRASLKDGLKKFQDPTVVRKILELRQIWLIKYCKDSVANTPPFLCRQFSLSRSRVGEVAWLMHKLARHEPEIIALWEPMNDLLSTITGLTVDDWAQWYFLRQLAGEAKEMVLREKKLDQVFFYKLAEDIRPFERQAPLLQEAPSSNNNRKGPDYLDVRLLLDQIAELVPRIAPSRILVFSHFLPAKPKGQIPDCPRTDLPSPARVAQETRAREPPFYLSPPSTQRTLTIDPKLLVRFPSPWEPRGEDETQSCETSPFRRELSWSPSPSARGGGRGAKTSKKRGSKGGDAPDPRIINLRLSMPRSVPAPLRFARNRALRHWTIHRAWLLFQRKERERQNHELERMYQSMHNACEELRKTSGPGLRDEGYLYRKAMEKHGMYGHNAVPIDYARPQTETPAREPWNHGWTR